MKIGKDGIIHCGDCFSKMAKMKDNSVDMIFTDPPYAITQNKWDTPIDLKKMWEEFYRVVKENAAIVITTAQPFTSNLIMSNVKDFKYEVIWQKTIGSGQLNIKKQPLRVHENICIFYRKPPVYNEQKTEGKPYTINRKANYKNENYGAQKDNKKENDGFRHAQTIVKIPNPRIKGGHPTQKPVALMENFIKTFTDEGMVVLDPFMGFGTTGEACFNLNRKFVGIEMEREYFNKAKERLLKCK